MVSFIYRKTDVFQRPEFIIIQFPLHQLNQVFLDAIYLLFTQVIPYPKLFNLYCCSQLTILSFYTIPSFNIMFFLALKYII